MKSARQWHQLCNHQWQQAANQLKVMAQRNGENGANGGMAKIMA
jgi:hypothetical protein